MSHVWFVTGSSRGLGRAVVEHALRDGGRVVATARNPDRLDDLVSTYGESILPVPLDVTDNDAVAEAVAVGLETFGRYDVVVNNAGSGDTAAIEDVDLADFRAQIETNFYGAVHVTKAMVPILREQGSGHIFQVSSLSSRMAFAGLGAYQSAKWALCGFSLTLAQEVTPLGIRVTVLEPGGMRTEWTSAAETLPPISAPYERSVGEFARLLRDVSGHEASDPGRIAEAISTLAESEDPPVRILLGPDAVEYAARAEQDRVDSDATWQDLSVSVACREDS